MLSLEKGINTRSINSSASAKQLELVRHVKPIVIQDRGIFYKNYYHLNGGKNWTNSFFCCQ
ncbi:MAG: hypothetical protein JO131_04300 [Gammaproteobacteria bacterium]|nr:hypothetical protein [Gammaproteobacteria bacterium]